MPIQGGANKKRHEYSVSAVVVPSLYSRDRRSRSSREGSDKLSNWDSGERTGLRLPYVVDCGAGAIV